MTNNQRLELLRKAVAETGSQVKVAAKLGYSTATISQVLNETYLGGLDAVLTRVEEVFSSRILDCPLLGEINLARCVKERRRSFSAVNPQRVKLYRKCKACALNSDIPKAVL
jgi:hypothetical protein